MKRAIMTKKILKIISLPLVIISIIFIYIASLVNNNRNYLDSVTKNRTKSLT